MHFPGRLPSLDVLRGVAILLVIGRHLPVIPDWPQLQGFTRDIFRVWHRAGWIGVDLFFVLSGFLVSGLIFREYQLTQQFRPLHFLVRRGFKIYPAFYFCAGLTYIWIYRTYGGHVVPWQGIVGELFFLQNYLGGFILVTWSLAIEEHFYFALALLLFLLARRGGENPFRAIPMIFAFIAIGFLLFRTATFDAQNYSYALHLMPTHKRADALFYGVFLCYLHRYHPEDLARFYHRFKLALIPAALFMLAYAFFHNMEQDTFIHTIGFSLHSLAFSILLLAALLDLDPARMPIVFSLPARAIGFIGVYSYSIYLWHETLFKALWSKSLLVALVEVFGFVGGFYVALLLLLLAAIVWGVLVALIIEMPFLKLRDRWFPSRSGPSKTASDQLQTAPPAN